MMFLPKEIRPYARRQSSALLPGGVLASVGVLVDLATPWPLSLLVGHVLTPGHPISIPAGTAVGLAASVTVLIAVVSGLVDYWSTRLLSSAGLRMAADIRVDVFAHLQRLSLRYHSSQRVGDLTTRVTGDVDRMQDLFVQTLSVLIPNTLLVTGMAAVMVLVDPGFAMIALTVTPVMGLVVFRSTRALKAAARRARKADGQVAAATTEGLGAVQVVQAFSLERRMRRRIQGLINESTDSGLEAVRLQARFMPAVDIASALSAAVVLWVGALRVLHGSLDVSVLLVFLGYVTTLYRPLKALARLSTALSKGVAASERVFDVLGQTPEVTDRPDAITAKQMTGLIEISDVSFSYGREPVLDGLNLRIEAGETVALVGPTGSGKSTIAALLARLMDPQQGCIRVDGTDLRSFTVASLRSQISLVLQDCLLLDASLYDNIACVRPGVAEWQVRDAARLALVNEFADRLPYGLHTMVGERGASLSGGQRQRVAIARAIVRDAPILVLDEPTSALDALSERLIVAAVAQLPAGRTTLVIAHRLSTVRRADRIAVLRSGQIAEIGTPSELLRAGGLYADLAHAQQGADLVTDVPLSSALSPTVGGRQ
jgi:ATP-binding cassette subfamily B protein